MVPTSIDSAENRHGASKGVKIVKHFTSVFDVHIWDGDVLGRVKTDH